MTLPPLATAADLVAAGATGTDAAIDMALRRASARVRKYTRQDITFVASETVELPGGERVLRLPQYPLVVDGGNPLTVVEVADFSGIEWTAIEGRDYSRLGNELTRGFPWQAPTRLMGWPWNRPQGVWAPKVRVTYSHGYEEVPDDIVDVVLDLATMNLSNPGNLREVAIDDYRQVFASETIGGARLSRSHKEDLRPYRRAAFSVVPS
ncbi:hypothetical protein [Streptomyces nymphaeiformis]|uniref:Uncharacterized protein n=1 Tax=Streptomyces nymphaeiformis TaxID=2663842 RepID=A0A7W7U5H5_9ACTN|nr:hypothetical protein [Streptomyces nymphaeiformis]MBB4985031.1 hypothetical protein [Streptomyces nymphaeiformis]